MALRTRAFGSASLVLLALATSGGCSVLGGFGDFTDQDPAEAMGGESSGDGDGDGDGTGGTGDGDGDGDGDGTGGTGDGDGDGTGGTGDGDGDSLGGGIPVDPTLSNCQNIGGPVEVFTNAMLEAVSPGGGFVIDSQQDYALVTGGFGAYMALAINGTGEARVFARGIPQSAGDPLSPIVDQPVLGNPQSQHEIYAGIVEGQELELFGESDGLIVKWIFEAENDSGLLPPMVGVMPSILDDTCTTIFPGANLRRVAFDVESEQFAFVCERWEDACDAGLCRIGAVGCGNDTDCCTDGDCGDGLELRLSSDPSTVLATADQFEDDFSLNLQHYVHNQDAEIITGEFTASPGNLRAGQGLPHRNPNFRDPGDSFITAAVPGPDGSGAVVFGLHATGALPDGPATFDAALLSDDDINDIERTPLEPVMTSYDFTGGSLIPGHPIVGGRFISLGVDDFNFHMTAGISAYERDGTFAVDRYIVREIMSGRIERVRATATHELLAQFVVTWVEDDFITSKVMAQRVACSAM